MKLFKMPLWENCRQAFSAGARGFLDEHANCDEHVHKKTRLTAMSYESSTNSEWCYLILKMGRAYITACTRLVPGCHGSKGSKKKKGDCATAEQR